MDESSTGSVEDLYSGLCAGPAMKAVHRLGSQESPLSGTKNLRSRCSSLMNQDNNPLSDQDDDALVIDAQDDPDGAAETGSAGTEATGLKASSALPLPRTQYSDDFAALESGEWRLKKSSECATVGRMSNESFEAIKDLTTDITNTNDQTVGETKNDVVASVEASAASEVQTARHQTESTNSSPDEDQSDDSSVAVNLEGDTDLEDEPPIHSDDQHLEESDVKESKVQPAQTGIKKEEDALSALNNVLDILCEKDPSQETLSTECGPKRNAEPTYNDLYDDFEELSSGESSIPNEADSNDAMIEDLLDAASEVSSGEDEMLKRNETLVETCGAADGNASEDHNKENGAPKKDGEADSAGRVDNSDVERPSVDSNLPDVKTNGSVPSFKLKRKSGLEEGELSDSNSDVSHTSRRIHRLKRKRREKERAGLSGFGLSGGRVLKLTKVTKVLTGADTRSSRNSRAVSPLGSRLGSGLGGEYSSSDSDSPVKAPLVLDHRNSLIRKMVVLSPSPLREENSAAARTPSLPLASTTSITTASPTAPTESVAPWKKPSSSSKHRNYRQSGNDITATNHLQTTLTVVASTGSGKKRRPDREVYQVRKRRSRSPVSRSSTTKRHSDSRSKRSKRSLSVERDRARSRSPRRRSRSRSAGEKRKKNKVRRRSTERKSKKKKKSKAHKKTRLGDRSRSRSVSPADRDSRDTRRRSPETKKSKRRSPSRSASRSRSRSLYLPAKDSAVSKDDNKSKSSKSPEAAPKKRKKKAHNKALKDRIGEVVVIDSSRENSPARETDAPGKEKNEKEVVESNNKETKEKQISAKGENLVINVNFKKKKLMNIFGDDASDEEPVEKNVKDDKACAKSSVVSPANNNKKTSPVGKGPQTPPPNTADDEYDPCEPLADSPNETATPTNDERDQQQPVALSQQTRIPGLGSPSPLAAGRDSPATLPSHGHGKPTVAVLPIVDNKSPRTKDQRSRRSPVKVQQQPPQPPLPPPQSRDKPPSPAPPPALAPPPVPSFLFSQPPPNVQPQYIVMNPYLVNPYHAMMPMQAATAPLVASAAPVAQVSLTAATASRDTGLAPAAEGSPYSPGESPLFNDPITPPTPLSAEETAGTSPTAKARGGGVFDQIAAGVPRQSKRKEKKKHKVIVKTAGQLMAESAADGDGGADKERYVRMDESQMKILDELPSSAVELQVKEKFLQKLHRQERVVEEVKLALKPFYNKKQVSKDDYKLIMKKCVPKICHNKNGEINPAKIKALVEGYVKKFRHSSRKHKQAPSQTSQNNATSAGAVGNS